MKACPSGLCSSVAAMDSKRLSDDAGGIIVSPGETRLSTNRRHRAQGVIKVVTSQGAPSPSRGYDSTNTQATLHREFDKRAVSAF